MKVEEIIEFITECEPKFSKLRDNEYKFSMFTAPTQHIKADTIEELLAQGIHCYKEIGNQSGFSKAIKEFESREVIPNTVDVELHRAINNYFKGILK